MMPLPTVTGQSRPLHTKDRPDLAATDFRGQAFEAGTLDPTRTASPQIVIHNDDVLEAQRASSIRETELEACAFLVANQLAGCGLTNINDRFPRKTFRREFWIHPLLRFQAARFGLRRR